MNLSKQNKCSICLNNITFYSTPWTCGHQFHSQCIKTWCQQGKSCPLCRETKKATNGIIKRLTSKVKKKLHSNYTYQIDANYSEVITIKKYPWDKKKCKADETAHNVIYTKPYGVLGCCSCGAVKSYNWVG